MEEIKINNLEINEVDKEQEKMKSFLDNYNFIIDETKKAKKFVTQLTNIRSRTRYDEKYIDFFYSYINIFNSLILNLELIFKKHFYLPTFLINHDDISKKIAYEIKFVVDNENFNKNKISTLVGVALKNGESYFQEIFEFYVYYLNFLEKIGDKVNIEGNDYLKVLK